MFLCGSTNATYIIGSGHVEVRLGLRLSRGCFNVELPVSWLKVEVRVKLLNLMDGQVIMSILSRRS
jgi:hypothetical protein